MNRAFSLVFVLSDRAWFTLAKFKKIYYQLLVVIKAHEWQSLMQHFTQAMGLIILFCFGKVNKHHAPSPIWSQLDCSTFRQKQKASLTSPSVQMKCCVKLAIQKFLIIFILTFHTQYCLTEINNHRSCSSQHNNLS